MRPGFCAVPVIALLFAACARGADDEGAGAVGARVVTGAKTMIVAEQPFAETVEATAVVSGRPDRMATLAAPSAARIAAVRVVVGQHVSAGDVLVELDQVAIHAAIHATDAALAAAEKQQARLVRLADAGIAARREVETAATELAAARAASETAHRQAELAAMRSPIAGVVTQVSAVLGAMADPARALVQVADGRVLDLALNLPPAQAARLHAGARIDVLGEGTNGESLGDGVLTAIGGAIDSATQAVAVRAAVRRSTRPLQIGESVAVRIVAGTRAKALVVPLESLVPDGEGFKVFVVDATGVAHGRPVETGGRSATAAEIMKGLAVGERVVTYGAYGMDDGVKVAPDATSVPGKP